MDCLLDMTDEEGLVFINKFFAKYEGKYEARIIWLSPRLGQKVKDCPMCAETIKAKAIICRFCGHKFEPDILAWLWRAIRTSFPLTFANNLQSKSIWFTTNSN